MFKKTTPDTVSTIEGFWEAVAKTIAHASPLVRAEDPRDCLRSFDRKPAPLSSDYHHSAWSVLSSRYFESMETTGRDLRGGRLLAYFPDENLCDGAAAAESKGFLDVDNAPPWDCWVAFITDSTGEYLVAWVPPEFVALAEAGIQVIPEECTRWLNDTETVLAKQLGG